MAVAVPAVLLAAVVWAEPCFAEVFFAIEKPNVPQSDAQCRDERRGFPEVAESSRSLAAVFTAYSSRRPRNCDFGSHGDAMPVNDAPPQVHGGGALSLSGACGPGS